MAACTAESLSLPEPGSLSQFPHLVLALVENQHPGTHTQPPDLVFRLSTNKTEPGQDLTVPVHPRSCAVPPAVSTTNKPPPTLPSDTEVLMGSAL